MINLILVAAGATLLIYSVGICHKLNKAMNNCAINKPCWIILTLIYLFIAGYLAFFIRLLYSPTHTANELLVSVIFFFGAVFVLIMSKTNYELIFDLIKKSSDLENKNQELSRHAEELKLSKQKYKERSEELDKTLDSFYTLRLGMERDMKKNVLEEENRKIKERLDELKKENI